MQKPISSTLSRQNRRDRRDMQTELSGQIEHITYFNEENGFRLASGIQLDNRSIISNDRGNHSHWHTGAYIAASREFGGHLMIGTGIRMDYDQLYEFELLPQLNISYNRNRWNLRSSLGRSIRSPVIFRTLFG